jgi:two-component system sensor histidine kinase/response regulator
MINQLIIKKFLALSDISVEMANNGLEVLKLLENSKFDAVLMDIHMPEMDGFEATKIIRSQPRFADLPVIALTAGVTKEEQEKCMALGMNDFIAKPINPEKLTSTLLQWINPVAEPATHIDFVVPSENKLPNAVAPENVNPQASLAIMDSNRELDPYLQLTFMATMENVADQIETMITAGNFVAARELTHKLKGASANIGAMRLSAATEALESGLIKGLSTVTLSTFREVFDQTMFDIAALQTPEDRQSEVCYSNEILQLGLAQLDELLNGNDFISETLLNTLKSRLKTDQLDLFAQLRNLINSLEYEKARTVLRKLAKLAETQDQQ